MKQGWTIKEFEKCIAKVKYTPKILSSDYLCEGKYPIVSQEKELISGYWEKDEDVYFVNKPVVIFGDHTKIVKYIDFDFVLGADGVKILLPINDILSKFLYYYIQNINLDALGYARHYKLLKNTQIRYPSFLEQERIVRILDIAFAKIEALRANAQQNLQSAKDLFQASIDKAYAIPTTTKSIISVAKVINGYAFSSDDFKPTNAIKSIKITNVGVGEFIEEFDNYLPTEYADKLQDVQVNSGDIVIALTRTIISTGLKVAVVPNSYNKALVNQRVAALVPFDGIMSQKYLYNFLLTTKVKNYVLEHVNTLMQPNLSITDLKNMDVPYLSYEEQKVVASKIDALSERCRAMEENYCQTLTACNDLKQALLKQAFNGEL